MNRTCVIGTSLAQAGLASARARKLEDEATRAKNNSREALFFKDGGIAAYRSSSLCVIEASSKRASLRTAREPDGFRLIDLQQRQQAGNNLVVADFSQHL